MEALARPSPFLQRWKGAQDMDRHVSFTSTRRASASFVIGVAIILTGANEACQDKRVGNSQRSSNLRHRQPPRRSRRRAATLSRPIQIAMRGMEALARPSPFLQRWKGAQDMDRHVSFTSTRRANASFVIGVAILLTGANEACQNKRVG